MTQIPEAFSEMIKWLKPLCRFNKLEDFIICDYNYEQNGLVRFAVKFFTKDNQYSISARLPEVKNDGRPLKVGQTRKVKNDGYLSCIASTRKPRAGEDWNRGRDLADGSYSKETFDEIVYDILAYELVKVAKKIENPTPEIELDKEK